MNCIKFISKLFAPKESQIPCYSPLQVLSMDPRKTTTQQRKKARLEMKQQHFNNYNNQRASRCIEPITYDDYNKMLKLEELHYEKDKERYENNRMSCFDKKKNNNQKKLLYKNNNQKKLLYRNYGPTDEFAGMNRKEREAVEAQRKYTEYMRRTAAGETDKGRRDFERLTYIRKKRGLVPGWTLYGIDYDVSDIDSDVSDIDSDVADIDSDVSDDEIKESKLFNFNPKHSKLF
jgi:hypothetical protein